MQKNQRGFIQIVVTLLLLAGLAATLYLVTRSTFFKPKASNSTTGIETVDDSGNIITQTNTNQIKLRLNYVPPTSSWPDIRFATAGQAVAVLGGEYYYNWDASGQYTNPSDEPYPSPNHTFARMVGKMVHECNGGCNQAIIDQIYNEEEAGIRSILSRDINKGGVWIVGNEPNCCPYIDPALYAAQYKRYHDLIKGLDPTAKIANGGVLSIDYLNTVLNHLNRSDWPDIYNIHLYSFSKNDIQNKINVQQARDWKNYRTSIGEADKPFWVTEFGLNLETSQWADQTDVNNYLDYMIPAFVNEHLADRWFWFVTSNNDGDYSNGRYKLIDEVYNGQITPTGQHYKELAQTYSQNPINPPFPTSFKVANSIQELANASEQNFDSNGKIITWFLPSGNGQKTIYTQFKVNGIWTDPVTATVDLEAVNVDLRSYYPNDTTSSDYYLKQNSPPAVLWFEKQGADSWKMYNSNPFDSVYSHCHWDLLSWSNDTLTYGQTHNECPNTTQTDTIYNPPIVFLPRYWNGTPWTQTGTSQTTVKQNGTTVETGTNNYTASIIGYETLASGMRVIHWRTQQIITWTTGPNVNYPTHWQEDYWLTDTLPVEGGGTKPALLHTKGGNLSGADNWDITFDAWSALPSPTPVPTPTNTPQPTAIPTPVPTATPTPAATPISTATPTPIPTPTGTPAPTATLAPTSTPQPTSIPTSSPSTSSTNNPSAGPLIGDLNNDGKVDISDYNILVSNFGNSGANLTGDLNNDGKVDIYDYNLLLQNYGR